MFCGSAVPNKDQRVMDVNEVKATANARAINVNQSPDNETRNVE